MNKKLIAILIAAMMMISLVACGKSKEAAVDEPMTGMPNPWTDITEEQAIQTTYVLFKAPEGATNVQWRMMEPYDENGQKADEEPLIEMDFTLNGNDFTARAQTVGDAGIGQYIDISGMYYDWAATDGMQLANWNMPGEVKAVVNDDEAAMLALWFDIESGVTYSLGVQAEGENPLDGLDIQAVAEQMYDETKVFGYDAPDADAGEPVYEEHVTLDIDGCDTFTQIVDQKLTAGMGYANTTINGTDVLLVASGTYDLNAGEGDPMWGAIDAEIYMYDNDGKIQYAGYVTAGGTAYPLAVKDGLLYLGSNHAMQKVTLDTEMPVWYVEDEVRVEYDTDGNETYYHHYESNGKPVDEEVDDDTLYNELFDEYMNAEVIEFSTVG